MLKPVLCAAVAAGFVAVAALSVEARPAVAPGTPCHEAAKKAYPDNHRLRHHYKKSCVHNWKHAKKG